MKKYLFTLLLFIFPLFSLNAVPGVESFIQDVSGEYVYYRDFTFNRESYIGILYYDEATYQVRYFAPKDDANFIPEKAISILMTVNPEANHWEMTGEKIISTILPGEDVDIVNYLHDIMYELSARRKHIDFNHDFISSSVSISEDYPQFGGTVSMNYEQIVPIFNLYEIRKPGDLEHGQFDLVTIGQLANSEDKSFENFKGFKEPFQYNVDKKLTKKARKAKAKKVTFEKNEIRLDDSWTSSMENMWFKGDDAIITFSTIPNYSSDLITNRIFIGRKMIESSQDAYVQYRRSAYMPKDDSLNFEIYTETYQPEADKFIVSYKIFSLVNEDSYDFFNLTAYKKPFEEINGYYLDILKSYKHN